MTNVRPLSVPPVTPRAQDLTRVRPAGDEISNHPSVRGASVPISSPRVSVPSPGEVHRQVRSKKNVLLALYWAAGIVAMLTTGGILTAMIARGDADSLIQHNTPPQQQPIVITIPAATPIAPATAPVAAPVDLDTTGAKAAQPTAPAAPVAKKRTEKTETVIPGAKPGQIVDLQLWKSRTPPKEGTTPNVSGTSNTPKGVSTPDNDPAVRLARDQLESTFK